MCRDEQSRKIVCLCIGEYVGKRNISGFLLYCSARISRNIEEMNYKIYVTDMLQNLSDSYISVNGGNPASQRFYDVVYRKDTPKDGRTGEQIVVDLIKHAGLEIV